MPAVRAGLGVKLAALVGCSNGLRVEEETHERRSMEAAAVEVVGVQELSALESW